MLSSPNIGRRTRLLVNTLERRDAPAIVPVGGEFRVNTSTPADVAAPVVALDGAGDFVVAWQAYGADGDDNAVLARRFASNGVGQGAEFQVNTFTFGSQQHPAVAMDVNGNFIVVWGSASAQAGSREDVFARRYAANGSALTTETLVNQFTLNVQGRPAVAMDGAGDFVVAWESNYQDGDGYAVYARKYSASGTPLTNEFRVNVNTIGDQTAPSVAIDATGDFVVVWQSPDADGTGVFARRYDSDGNALGGEIAVNTTTVDEQTLPSVAASPAGDFAVVWQSRVQDNDTAGVYLRRFTASGIAQGSEARVNTYTVDDQVAPAVSANYAGELAITWQSAGQDGSGAGVFAQRVAANGVFIGNEFRVTTSTAGNQSAPAISADSYGDFVVAWIADSAPDQGVYAQRFAKPPVPRATFTINDGAPQRSTIQSITLAFNTLVNIGPGGVMLSGPAGAVGLNFDYSASTMSQTTVKVTFSGAGVTPGGLIDGLYTLTLDSSLVTNYDNEGYDGDGDGLPGPNGVFTFHRLFGDGNGDRMVNGIDFLYFRLSFLTSSSSSNFENTFDYDNNGVIDGGDFLQFRLRFLQSI